MRRALPWLAVLVLAGCRMGPMIEGPEIGPSEFDIPMGAADTLRESDVERWRGVSGQVEWPVNLAVLQVHRDSRYAALAQGEWEEALRASGHVRRVSILDGLAIPPAPGGATDPAGSLFLRERWAAATAGADLLYLYVTKLASDTFWNHWFMTYVLVVPIPFVPAQEQTAQAVTKGFLVDVKTGKILETVGTLSTLSRRANPILRTEPLFQLEVESVHDAETGMVRALAGKIADFRAGGARR